MGPDKKLNPLIHEYHLEQEGLNQKLDEIVHQEITRTTGIKEILKHSNIGGWHSERNLDAKLGDGSPASNQLLLLFDSFSAPITDYIRTHHTRLGVPLKDSYEWNYAGAWYNVAFGGSYNSPHVHPGSQISAGYYIRTEQPTPEHPYSGRIDFIDKNNIQYGFFPKPGTLFLFPGDMLHWVHPYYGSDIRICLSFNAKFIR